MVTAEAQVSFVDKGAAACRGAHSSNIASAYAAARRKTARDEYIGNSFGWLRQYDFVRLSLWNKFLIHHLRR